MLKKFNFKSKKGISLAVSLTICLFLILVTGGITTVAMLQHNETGSNMNTRQAYLSAKSGLDTIQDALQLQDIGTAHLPSAGNEKYYVFYYDSSNELCFNDTATSEQAARDLVKQLAKDNPNWEIVGGEGTYFKVENNDGKYKVTALNTTGKYNGNVSMNRGDLSFDAIIMTKYKFELHPAATASTPSGSNPPSGSSPHPTSTPSTTPPSTGPTNPTSIPTQPKTPVPNVANKFMMIGQQSCLNDTYKNGSDDLGWTGANNVTTGVTLAQYNKHNGSLFYIPYNENGVYNSGNTDEQYAYSYFPIVYDRMVKCTSDVDRVSLAAINEGIYLLGSYDDYANLNEFYSDQHCWQQHRIGPASYVTQNDVYQPVFGCKFFVVENNFISLGLEADDCPVLKYEGTEGRNYVIAYIPRDDVRFMVINKDSGFERDNQGHTTHKSTFVDFTVKSGYYYIETDADGTPICNKSTWSKRIADKLGFVDDDCVSIPGINNFGGPNNQTIIDPHWTDFNLYDSIQLLYKVDNNRDGKVHSGCNETEQENVDPKVMITDNVGGYNTDAEEVNTCYSKGDSFNYDAVDRSQQHIFLSPNRTITEEGFYNWYCGRSFNFQWFRPFDLTVNNRCHVKMSSGSIVMTIGPAVTGLNGQTVNVSNTMVGYGDASWTLYGNKGTGSPTKLIVMCGFNVVYDGNKYYYVKPGEYTNVSVGSPNKEGLDLFSDEAKDYFENKAIIRSLETGQVIQAPATATTTIVSSSTSNSDSVMPASVTAQTTRLASLFSRIRSGAGLTPMVTLAGSDIITNGVITDADGDRSATLNGIDSTIVVDNKLNHLYYDSPASTNEYHSVTVGNTMVIYKKIGDTEYPYMEFSNIASDGEFKIHKMSPSESLDLLNGQVLYERAGMANSNYDAAEPESVVEILEKYY